MAKIENKNNEILEIMKYQIAKIKGRLGFYFKSETEELKKIRLRFIEKNLNELNGQVDIAYFVLDYSSDFGEILKEQEHLKKIVSKIINK